MGFYESIDHNAREHLLRLIGWLYDEVISAGGDGDAFWYSQFYDIKDLFSLVEEFNNRLKSPWEISQNRQTIHWGKEQEGMVITNDHQLWLSCPEWIQVRIYY